jgi:hypothetical protein
VYDTGPSGQCDAITDGQMSRETGLTSANDEVAELGAARYSDL